MKLSHKVLEEIDFLEKFFGDGSSSTQLEKEQYFLHTVKGQNKTGVGGIDGTVASPLFLAKRNLDITIKMWRFGFLEGTLIFHELLEEYGAHPYGKKLLYSIAELRRRDELKVAKLLKQTPPTVTNYAVTQIPSASLVKRLYTWIYAKYMRTRYKEVEIGTVDLF